MPTVKVAPSSFDGLFGASPAMRHVMEQVHQAAGSKLGVIITGEPGTGREMVARAIHEHGPAPGAPFITVDCSKSATHDLDLELFGVAVSGRSHRLARPRGLERIGRSSHVRAARGGTLFLQHVVEMPSRVQATLAQILRDREAVMTDDGRSIALEVRPIVSVEPAFGNAVNEGRIRPELYKRLAAIRIDIPPLRQRREDVPALATHFLSDMCQSRGLPVKTLEPAALTLLAALPWRGNSRELQGLLESLAVLVTHPAIRLEDVLEHVRLDGGAAYLPSGGRLRDARREFERTYIAAALEQLDGKVRDAARMLGVQRTNLYKKMRQLRVEPRKASSR